MIISQRSFVKISAGIRSMGWTAAAFGRLPPPACPHDGGRIIVTAVLFWQVVVFPVLGRLLDSITTESRVVSGPISLHVNPTVAPLCLLSKGTSLAYVVTSRSRVLVLLLSIAKWSWPILNFI